MALAGVGAVCDPMRAGLDIWMEGVECRRRVEHGANGGERRGDSGVLGIFGNLVQGKREWEGSVDGAGGGVGRVGGIQRVLDDVCQDGIVL